MPCISINFSPKKQWGARLSDGGFDQTGSAVWPVFREMASSRWRDRPPNLVSMVSRCLSIAQKVTFLWSSLKCIILLCVPLLILCSVELGHWAHVHIKCKKCAWGSWGCPRTHQFIWWSKGAPEVMTLQGHLWVYKFCIKSSLKKDDTWINLYNNRQVSIKMGRNTLW